MKYLIIIITSIILCACNSGQKTSVTVDNCCNDGEIMAEDNTCVNSDFYANTQGLTDSQITENGGSVELN